MATSAPVKKRKGKGGRVDKPSTNGSRARGRAKVDPRQMHLIDPETKEAINEPLIIEEIDKAYMAESRMRDRIATMKNQLKKLVDETNEAILEHMPQIEKELGEDMPYITVNAHGQLRKVGMWRSEPRRYDEKCNYVVVENP